MKAKGEDVDRVKIWIETHKRKDESYVTEAIREIGEKIEEIRSRRPESIIKVSPNNALGIVLVTTWKCVPRKWRFGLKFEKGQNWELRTNVRSVAQSTARKSGRGWGYPGSDLVKASDSLRTNVRSVDQCTVRTLGRT